MLLADIVFPSAARKMGNGMCLSNDAASMTPAEVCKTSVGFAEMDC